MKNFEVRNMLLHAHYYLMGDKRFWYEKHLQEASKIMCVIASDILAHDVLHKDARIPNKYPRKRGVKP